MTPRTKMILINSPHNPTGSFFNESDLKELDRITDGTEVLIVSDEVYEHLLFDGRRHESVLRYPQLAARSFVTYSFGKTYHSTGWKMGYCIAPENLMKEFRRVHQFVVFCANAPMQYALADFMNNRNYLELPDFFQAKRDRFLELLNGSSFKFVPAAGSYFQLLDYSEITDEKDTDFAVRLTKEHGVASIPTSVFYRQPQDHRLLRFCFAKTDETLIAAANRLQRVRA
jgi:methionine aminotransferase